MAGTLSARVRPEWVLALGILDFSLEQAVIGPALPLVAERYSAGPTDVVWLFTAFLLSAAVATPLAGRLGDQVGRRRMLLLSLWAFAVGSVICALAGSLEVLIAGRAVQGLGTGTAPLALALVRDTVEPPRVSRAVGLLVGAAGAGSVFGQLGGSALVELGSLAALFWFLAGFSAFAALVVLRVMPETPVRSDVRIDWLGAFLLAAALVPLLLAVAQGNDWGWDSTAVLALLAGAAAATGLFVLRQRVAAEPLFDPALLARRPVWSAQVLTFLVGLVAFSHLAILPLLCGLPESTGYGLGLSTFEIGLVLVPSSVAALVSGPLAGVLTARVGSRAVIAAGLVLIALGNLILVVVPVTVTTVVLAGIPLGLAFGPTIASTLDLVLAASRRHESGAALGLTNEIRTVGTALGTAAVAAVLVAAGELVPGVPAASGFDDGFLAIAVAALVAALVVPLVPRGAPKHEAG